MQESRTSRPGGRWLLGLSAAALLVVGLVAGLVAGGVAGWVWRGERMDRAGIESIVREYILAHPEVLPEAMENLQRRENLKQLGAIREPLERPFPGAVLGNPRGEVTLVEFTDFGCTYCRQSVADVEALIRTNPDLRVVVREFPILSPQSEAAARIGLAAAEQGKYAAFHHAMFAAGRPDEASIAAAAQDAGLDLARARRVAANPEITAEIERNLALARQLGFSGTPSWVIGDEVITGAVGYDKLSKAVAQARN